MNRPIQRILHIGNDQMILRLRDEILRTHGYEVISTLSPLEGEALFGEGRCDGIDLVLVDVEEEERVPGAEKLCEGIRALEPEQRVGFVCNYLVSIESDCPDEVIRAEFNPKAFVEGVQRLLAG